MLVNMVWCGWLNAFPLPNYEEPQLTTETNSVTGSVKTGRSTMVWAEQICPACGCAITDESYEKGGVLYCCEPCATGAQCECGCCEVVEEKKEE
jgi:hypothetical protein